VGLSKTLAAQTQQWGGCTKVPSIIKDGENRDKSKEQNSLKGSMKNDMISGQRGGGDTKSTTTLEFSSNNAQKKGYSD